MTPPVIVSVKNLTKRYGDGTVAVNGINFEISQGEIFGFLGPNGAGKTTTIKILTTLLQQTSGRAIVAGFDIKKEPNKVRESIGVVFQQPALDGKLTALENLDFHARLYGIPKEQRDKRIKEVLHLVGLEKNANKFVERFSGGMKRRLEIARGLMHNPKILFLDEPTLGLDVQTRRRVWEYINLVQKKENMTIFLTTHYLEEAEKVCERIAIIDDGKILKIGSPDKMIEESSESYVIVKTKDKIKKTSNISRIKKVNEKFFVSVKDARKVTKVVNDIMKQYEIDEISIHKPSLEDVFLKLTGKTIREEEPRKRRRGPMR